MKFEDIFEKVPLLGSMFDEFYQHRKKIKAIDNYNFIKRFNDQEEKIFSTIKYCLKGSFLKKKDIDWLSSTLDELNINYLDWAHKTKWMKAQIAAAEKPKKSISDQMYIDIFSIQPTINIPLSVMESTKKHLSVRP